MLLRQLIPLKLLMPILVIVAIAASVYSQAPDGLRTATRGECTKNADPQYDRARLLNLFHETLEQSVPAYKQFPHDGYFVFDLVDPQNYFIPSQFAKSRLCIDFVDGRIYHFAPISLINSESHFAVLFEKKVDIFRSVNCDDGDDLDLVRSRLEGLRIGTKRKQQVLERLNNYRKFGYYVGIDEKTVRCN